MPQCLAWVSLASFNVGKLNSAHIEELVDSTVSSSVDLRTGSGSIFKCFQETQGWDDEALVPGHVLYYECTNPTAVLIPDSLSSWFFRYKFGSCFTCVVLGPLTVISLYLPDISKSNTAFNESILDLPPCATQLMGSYVCRICSTSFWFHSYSISFESGIGSRKHGAFSGGGSSCVFVSSHFVGKLILWQVAFCGVRVGEAAVPGPSMLNDDFCVVSWNAECKINSTDAATAMLSTIASSAPQWDVLYVAEHDKLANPTFTEDVSSNMYRHHPGVGSHAMAFYIQGPAISWVRSVRWVGRVGAVTFLSDMANGRQVCFFVVGIHVAHGMGINDSIAQLTSIMAFKPPGAKVLIVGDYNVDYLPCCPYDPLSVSPHRTLHHFYRRELLDAFIQLDNLQICFPSFMDGTPVGVSCDLSSSTPVTHVHRATGQPSLLGYALAGSGCSIRECSAHWQSVPSDHAFTRVLIDMPWRLPRPPTHFNIRAENEDKLVDWFRQESTGRDVSNMTLCDMISFVKEGQGQFRDSRTARERHRSRMPFALRCLYATLKRATAVEQPALQRRCWAMRKQWHIELRKRSANSSAARGRVLERSKKLYQIERLGLPPAVQDEPAAPSDQDSSHAQVNWSTDRLEWRVAISEQFGNKWGAALLDERKLDLDMLLQYDGCLPCFSVAEMEAAFRAVKNQRRMDVSGCSVAGCKFLFQACPDEFTEWISTYLASTADLAGCVVNGRVFGKASKHAHVCKLRAILPLPAPHQISDAVIANQVHAHLDRILPKQRNLFVGGRPCTQCQDISHAIQLTMERGLDDLSEAAVAQADIETFYDSLPIRKICLELIDTGLDPAVAAAAFRHQMMPRVELSSNNFKVASFNFRTIGGLTGSRVAGALARYPVESTMQALEPALRRWQFQAAHVQIMLAAYIDNMYAFSSSVFGATAILEAVEDHIKDKWSLRFKDSSREVMPAAENPCLQTCEPHWAVVSKMDVLGACVQNDNGTDKALAKLRSRLRAAFWRNARHASFRLLSVQAKFTMIQRATLSVLRFGASGVIATPAAMADLDHLQRGLFASFIVIERNAAETNNEYFTRKRNHVRNHPLCCGSNAWSHVWAQQILHWDAHLQRERSRQSRHLLAPSVCETAWSFAAQLTHADFHANLNTRRSSVSSPGESRLRRRRARRVFPRWHDAVAVAHRKVAALVVA